ncbi:hypothetical protein BO94DRAFT_134671 [Aspergillus sclerotioniger CBS 115572]|uniref:Uncharacterized protein n=1 Tax=Aspergillus sclerotioniger CBS 115572 TaxID=1450535 RepID=A0A317XDN4_9EURO|nr:hypothetical protein BO94DRAFT_134671 [Aspergillus sclerotioniger CBS 115572]PWY95717.1 hypothetical protein BO94DRAFT_134671 [Aspergillus sclerotioniger CBS 115572]
MPWHERWPILMTERLNLLEPSGGVLSCLVLSRLVLFCPLGLGCLTGSRNNFSFGSSWGTKALVKLPDGYGYHPVVW